MFGSATSAYVTDLPVRLNKKFYPPRQPDASVDIFINTPLRFPAVAIVEEYDFCAERKALDDFKLNLQQQAAEHSTSTVEKNQPLDRHQTVDNGSFDHNSSSSSYSSISGNEEPVGTSAAIRDHTQSTYISPLRRPITAVPTVPISTSNGILQPVVAKVPSAKSTNDNSNSARPVLRLEDFENVTSSPFDMVELKSINDIEELRRLWTQPQPNGFIS